MQTHLTIRNPLASADLRIPLTIEPNMAEEAILANVLYNSRRAKRWVKTEKAHDRVAILCGGGPSLADTSHELASLYCHSGDIFALNGTAKFLAQRYAVADYQIIMDAQPATADLVGPAGRHLFASQVDPRCFEQVPGAILWHATFGNKAVDEQEGFPEHEDDYCLIGSSVNVGNTALVLLYALVYREIHCFGYDCSQAEGRSHAYAQPMNAGEPCSIERFNGKEYVCSVSMAYAARHFIDRARLLEKEGCKIYVHGSGYLPDMWNTKLSEPEKYRLMWEQPEYRVYAPGEHCVDEFLHVVKPNKGDRVIDFGCGTGRAALKLHDAGLVVTLVDFASGCRDSEALDLPFVEADLTRPVALAAPYGFCTDVLEHLPTEGVQAVIKNIMRAAGTVYFQVSTVPDVSGALIGAQLHLTVKPHAWWGSLFESLGYHVAYEREAKTASVFVIQKGLI
jgi:hypothetical protein